MAFGGNTSRRDDADRAGVITNGRSKLARAIPTRNRRAYLVQLRGDMRRP